MKDCKTELDLVFILDGTSVSDPGFALMLKFVQNVITKLEVAKDVVMVGVVEHGVAVDTIIPFDDFTTKEALINTIGNIDKSPSPWTSTDFAISATTYTVFSETNDARPNAARMAIQITNNHFDYRYQTYRSAKRAKANGIVMVTLGVGNVNIDELQVVASAPNCTHVIVLNDFSEIDAMVYQLKETACAAPKVIFSGQTVTKMISPDRNITVTFEHPGAQSPIVVIATVQCGTLDMYASYMTSRPGQAFFDYKEHVIEGGTAVLFPESAEGRSLYITVVGRAKATSCLNPSYTFSVKPAPALDDICSKTRLEPSKFYFPYPEIRSKYIQCDESGVAWVRSCPIGLEWNDAILNCDHPQTSTSSNKCTGKSTGTKFEHADQHKYIECVHGEELVRDCPSGLVYKPDQGICNWP